MAGCREDAHLTDLSYWYSHISRNTSVLLLLILRVIGIAAAYAAWVPDFRCSSSNGDEEGVCELVIMYMLIGTWVIPVLRE